MIKVVLIKSWNGLPAGTKLEVSPKRAKKLQALGVIGSSAKKGIKGA